MRVKYSEMTFNVKLLFFSGSFIFTFKPTIPLKYMLLHRNTSWIELLLAKMYFFLSSPMIFLFFLKFHLFSPCIRLRLKLWMHKIYAYPKADVLQDTVYSFSQFSSSFFLEDKFIANSQTSINVIIRWWNWGETHDTFVRRKKKHRAFEANDGEKCKCCNSAIAIASVGSHLLSLNGGVLDIVWKMKVENGCLVTC